LRAIAVTSENRLPGYEDIPTVGETIPGFAISAWTAMFAPAGTPPAIVDKVNRDVTKILESPDVQAKMSQMGNYTFKGSAQSLADFMDHERPTWIKLVKDLNIELK
jgi:tripartite-type tricarboxylate transporter receptor subunit TctC